MNNHCSDLAPAYIVSNFYPGLNIPSPWLYFYLKVLYIARKLVRDEKTDYKH